MVRMRSIPKAVAEIRVKDPETNITAGILRRWVKEGKLPMIKTGKNFLVNMELLENYLAGNQ